MENQNRFDLEQALRAWRADCAGRPGISFDTARELESDLRERVADLQVQGLNEKEAFNGAVRQVGLPGDLALEFARENPLAVWRDRLFWIVAAGFGVSVWGLLTNGMILWLVNAFSVLLPFRRAAWMSLCGNVPVLAMALLLATGRFERLGARMRFFDRRDLGLAGGCLLAAGVLVRLFGPIPLTAPESLLVKIIGISLWPLLLLLLGLGLFRPAAAPESAARALALERLPTVVWRERVFWMSLGALAVGLWQTVSWASMQALFYTGNINRPFLAGTTVFVGSYLLIELSPLMILGLLLHRWMRVGKDITAAGIIRSRAFFVIIPAVVCAWAVVHLWSDYSWRPAGSKVSWLDIAVNYFATFRWFWSVGLAWLILWLAPRRGTQPGRALATQIG